MGSSGQHKLNTNKANNVQKSSKIIKGKLMWFEKHLETLTHTATSLSHTDEHNSGSAAYYTENINGVKDEKILH